jgi:hypothetical protein
MPAHNDNFPWMSYYGNYNFFEQRMREHSKVNSIECYSFDTAEYVESCENYGPLQAVVISSNWCGYSLDVKRNCMSDQVGVFDTAGFMAAINRREYWTYLTEYERERFQENGWL